MNIGIPREILPDEHRISLTQGIYPLIEEGHQIFIEGGAGEGSRFTDEEFRDMGVQIVFSPIEVFQRSDIVVKVMPPTVQEARMVRPRQVIFSFLQLRYLEKASLETLLSEKVTAIGTELIEFPPGYRPFSLAMSEIAGNMLMQIAGNFLQVNHGGRGIAIGGFPGIPAAKVVILGAGNLGFNAAKNFLALGADVTVLDEDLARLRLLEERLSGKITTFMANPYAINLLLKDADIFIGAIYQRFQKTPTVVTEEMVRGMKARSLIIDAAIDQGGCVETSHPTTLSDPIFEKHGILHYCVPNIPSGAARTASHAMNNIVLPFILEITRYGLAEALRENPALQSGVYLHDGACVNAGVAELFDLPHEPLA